MMCLIFKVEFIIKYLFSALDFIAYLFSKFVSDCASIDEFF